MAIPYEYNKLPEAVGVNFNIDKWAGVNKRYTNDFEMVDCRNMTSDNYPYASPKKADKKVIAEGGIKRIYKVEGNKIYYIDKDEYLCYGEDGAKNFVTDKDGNKIQMNNVSCTNNYDGASVFYPDLQYITDENKCPSCGISIKEIII